MKKFLILFFAIGGLVLFVQSSSGSPIETNSTDAYSDDFDSASLDTSFWTKVEGDTGVTIEQTGGMIKVSGVSQDSNWGKNGLHTTVMLAQPFDLSVAFFLGYVTNVNQSINLRTYYGGDKYFGVGYDDIADEFIAYYGDHTGFHKLPNAIEWDISGSGMPTLRIIYDGASNTFQGFVENKLIEEFAEDSLGDTMFFQFHQESQNQGSFNVDAYFDDFVLRLGSPRFWECWEDYCNDPIIINGASMLSEIDGWAVGNNGHISHWDGQSWNNVPMSDTLRLSDVDMVSTSDGWAVGADRFSGYLFLHWDGATWSQSTSPVTKTLHAVDMLSSTDGWAVGYDNTIVRWDGISWQVEYSEPGQANWLEDVDMLSASDGWAVGSGGTTLHWNGNSWSLVNVPVSENLHSVSMLSSTNGWAVGDDGSILHWDGNQWGLVSSPSRDSLVSIDMLSTNDGWAVSSGWAAGNQIIHWDGNSWAFVGESSLVDPNFGVIEMVSANYGWVLGEGSVALYWNGSEWQDFQLFNNFYRLNSVSMSSAGDGWAVGDQGLIFHWDGNHWAESSSPTNNTILDVSAISESTASAVGHGGTILKWDGVSWQTVPSPTTHTLNAVFLRSVQEGWAVGEDGVILHWDGKSWNITSSPTTRSLLDVTSLSSGEAWAVAWDGLILYWDGTEWVISFQTEYYIRSISMLSPNDGWAVGTDYCGTCGGGGDIAYHWDGTNWSIVKSVGFQNSQSNSVALSSSGDGWAVGYDNVYRLTGQVWTEYQKIPAGTSLSVSLINETEGWIVGHGAIWHRKIPTFKSFLPMLNR